MANETLNVVLAPQFVINITHEMGDGAGFSIVAGIASTSVVTPMTDAEVKTAYENNANTNEYDDAEQTKLAGIETAATADQTNIEIRTAVGAAADSNIYTDLEKGVVLASAAKLAGIENNATTDQTDAEIRTAVEAAVDSNVFTDTDHTKLDAIEGSATADQTDAEIETAYNTRVAQVSAGEMTGGTETNVRRFSPDNVENMIAIHGLDEADLVNPVISGKLAWLTDVFLERDEANILAMRNGFLVPQMFRIYNTFTNTTNYERADIGWDNGLFLIGTSAEGTGSERGIAFVTSDTARWAIGINGDFIAWTDNVLNIGTTGANRAKDFFLAGTLALENATANKSAMIISGYSLTGANAQNMVDLSGTWNTTGAPTLIFADVLDTASDAGAMLINLKVGGVSMFSVTKAGLVTAISGLLMTDAQVKTAYENNSNTNEYDDAEQTKLAGIETAATADQTNAEIRTAVEAATDSNVFNDADHTKLNAIEGSATADQTDAEIETAYNTRVAKISGGEITAGTEVAVRRFSPDDVEAMIAVHAPSAMSDAEVKTAYENNADTNEYDDAEQTKLAGIETAATTDQTDAEIKTAYENNADSNAFTDALLEHYGPPLATTTTLTALAEASLFDKERRFVEGEISDYFYDATASAGDFAPDDQTGGTGWWLQLVGSAETAASIKTKYESNANTNEYDDAEQTKLAGIETAATADQTAAEIKTAYEGETNAFTDGQFTKLAGIETAATADQTNAEIRTAVEAATDSNVFNDADHTKLNAIEASAKDDQTAAEIVALIEPEAFTWTSDHSFGSQVALAGVLTPAQITATQNNYNPASLNTAVQLRLSTDASQIVRGIAGGAVGRLLIITNVGSFDLVLNDEDASSTAANRFIFVSGNLTLTPKEAVTLRYDITSNRWRAIDDRVGGVMSDAAVKTAYENNSDTNEFSDAEQTKLAGIETAATIDQTDAEIRTAVEAATDSNVFTDAESTKLAGVDTGAKDDQTGAEIKTAYQAETNAYTDTKNTKLSGIETLADVTDAANVDTAGAIMDSDVSAGEGHLRKTGAGAYVAMKTNLGATVAPGVSNDNTQGYVIGSQWIDVTADKEYVCLDITTGAAVWTETTGGGGGMSDAEVKTAYENNSNTNEYDDAEQSKLAAIEASATADQTDAEIRTAVEAATDSNVFTDADHSKLDAIIPTAINLFTANHTLALTDADDIVEMDSASANVLTIPTNASVAFPVGTVISVSMLGAGITTITAAGGVTLNGTTAGSEALGAIYDGASLYKSATDDWIIQGAINGTGGMTDAEVKTAYENNADTNEFDDAEQTKLSNIETAADVTDAANVASAGAVMDSDISAGEGILRKTGAGAYAAMKSNIGATVAPVGTNDGTQGYVVGSLWIDTTADKVWVCVDTTTAAAVWKDLSAASMSDAEVKTAYENNSDTNEYDDAEQTKLAGIETAATIDQTDAEIRTAVEAATDSNVFNDADHTKLNAIEASATIDQTDSEIETAYNAQVPVVSGGEMTAGTEVAMRRFSPDNVENMIQIHAPSGSTGWVINNQTGTTYTLVLGDNQKLVRLTNAAGITLTIPTNASVNFPIGAQVRIAEFGVGTVTIDGAGVTLNKADDLILGTQHEQALLIKVATDEWDIVKDLGGVMSDAAIKTAYENNSDTNEFSDAEQTKLAAIEDNATADQTNTEIRTAVGAATDSNVLTDALKDKVDAIEAAADVTDAANVGSAGAVMDSDISAGEGFLRKTGAGAYLAMKSNLAATTNPLVTSDTAAGYVVGSRWINVTLDTEYVCLDATNSAAVWIETTTGVMSDAAVKTAYENNSDTNEFSDAEQTKLAGIDTAATIDQTGAEIKTAYEAETNAFTDAKNTKLTGIDTGAKDDQTGAEIKTAYQAEANAYTDTKNTKLGTIEDSATADQTGAEIKTAYEAETNAYTDSLNTKLGNIETLADVTDTTNVTAAGAAMLGGAGMTVGSTHFNVQTGTTYTLVAGDNGKTVTLNNASAIVLTVPTGLGAGFRCSLLQLGAGQVTVTASSTTLNSLSGFLKIAGAHGVVGLLATVADTFAVAGDLVT